MGQLSNPLGFRIGRTSSWNSLWSSDIQTFKNNFVKENLFKYYFKNLFLNFRNLSFRRGFILSHVDVLKIVSGYIIKVYIYNSNIMKLQRNKFFYFWLRLRAWSRFYLRKVKYFSLLRFNFLKKKSKYLSAERKFSFIGFYHLKLSFNVY